MKRQSIAENTLNKQIKILNAKLEQIMDQQRNLQRQYETVRDLRDDMINEMNHLHNARLNASKKAKP